MAMNSRGNQETDPGRTTVPPEFDRFAADYERVHDRTLPPGARSRDFLIQKADMVTRWVHELAPSRRPLSVLDFGCGTGRLLTALGNQDWCGSMTGVDVSRESIQAARLAVGGNKNPVVLAESLADLDGRDRYDVVLMFNVIHHISDRERREVVRQLKRLVREDGFLAVWEHNPLNVVTRVLVALSPLDKTASLIRRSSVMRLMRECGFSCLRSRFVNCFPPPFLKIRTLAWMETALSPYPIGTQYWAVFTTSQAPHSSEQDPKR